MKFSITRKQLENHFDNIVCVGYCDLYWLLQNHQPIAYNSGVYGWNFDVYEVYGVTICTGYRNLVGRNVDNIETYERQARAIGADYTIDIKERRERIEKLLQEFCATNTNHK